MMALVKQSVRPAEFGPSTLLAELEPEARSPGAVVVPFLMRQKDSPHSKALNKLNQDLSCLGHANVPQLFLM